MKLWVAGVILQGVAGFTSAAKVKADTIDIGMQHGTDFEFAIDPHIVPVPTTVGVLATYTFRGFDLDLDFGAARMNVFSQDHCEGRVVYWLERPLAVVPISWGSGHIRIPVKVDGHRVTAIIDTGATLTSMSATVAKQEFGLNLGSAGTPKIGSYRFNPKLKYYYHKFNKLTFQGVTVANPKLLIMTDPTHRVLPKVTIGMDILRKLHLYFAFGESKLYLTPAGTKSALPNAPTLTSSNSLAAPSSAAPSAQLDTYVRQTLRINRYKWAEADLNGDGRPEQFVYATDRDFCGSGGCSLFVLSPKSDGYRTVLHSTMTQLPIRLLDTSTNGWRDIAVFISGGGVQAGFVRLHFRGGHYPSNPTLLPTLPKSLVGGQTLIAE